MARAVAFVPDLLFGSNVVGALQAAGHDTVLVANPDELATAASGADVLIIDLTADVEQRISLTAAVVNAGAPRTLAFFSHVETDVKSAAEAAGFDLVVPRSRMARAAAQLVDQLVATS